jgi:hypothetical protein
MGFVFLLMLLLIPASLVFSVIVTIKMLRSTRLNQDPKYIAADKRDWRNQLLVSAAVMVVCLAVLFFSGKFHSMSMTLQMSHISGVSAANNREGDTSVRIWTRNSNEVTFPGGKAVTLNINYGAYTNSAQEFVAGVLDIPNDILFRYDGAYIPEEYRANSAEQVGYLIEVRHFSKESNMRYTNGAHAYIHCIEVTICDDKDILAQETFEGFLDSDTTGDDTIGPAPEEQVNEWVKAQLDRLVSKNEQRK